MSGTLNGPGGAMTAFHASFPGSPWAGVPDEITGYLISFIPDSAAVMRAVSRGFKEKADEFLQWNKESVVSLCSSEDSPLYSLISRKLAAITNGPRPMSVGMNIQFQLSVPRAIRAFGVLESQCPDRILLPQEIVFFNGEVQKMQGLHLRKTWAPVREEVLSLADVMVPAPYASAREIRTWMHAHPTLLQAICHLNINALGLMCVPVEIGLLTGLRTLDLGHNQLHSLSPGLFDGMSRLCSLTLGYNRLHTLPRDVFGSLTDLRILDLGHNRLRSLPPDLFHQWTGLVSLNLRGNGLRQLPQDLFQGMANLFTLSLACNQLSSLPEDLFDELPQLCNLRLGGNRGLLFSWHEMPSERDANNIRFRETIKAFYSYESRSPLARFYQLAARATSPEALREPLAALPGEIKQAIFGLVCIAFGRSDYGNAAWGKRHVLDDMQVFHGALKSCVREKFYQLSSSQRSAVFGQVYTLARRERGADAVDFSDPQWGEHHAFDNILRLIDAMDLDVPLFSG